MVGAAHRPSGTGMAQPLVQGTPLSNLLLNTKVVPATLLEDFACLALM